MEHALFILVMALAFLFAFINGFHDGANIVAASVLSRSMSTRRALWVACVAELVGPLFLGTMVAKTLGWEIFDRTILTGPQSLAPSLFLMSGLISAVTWDLLTWGIGMPSSSPHGFLGGLVGGAVAAYGFGIIDWSKLFLNVFLKLMP